MVDWIVKSGFASRRSTDGSIWENNILDDNRIRSFAKSISCVEGFQGKSWPRNYSKKDEWKGTEIKWKIAKSKTGSNVTLIHQGLIPELECYEICQAGWNYFLGSLKNYLEYGEGYPYQEERAK